MKCFLEADKGKGAGYEIISTHDTYEDAIKEVVPLTLRQGDDELYLIQGRLYERYTVTS